MAPVSQTSPRPRPNVPAAVLSFLWPGLGQWYAGRPRAALLYGIPLLVLVGLLVAQLMQEGVTVFAVRLLDPSFSLTLLILIVLVGGWRILAILDAAVAGPSRRVLRGPAAAHVALLVVAVIGMHALAASYAYSFYTAGSRIFVADNPSTDQDSGAVTPSSEPSDDYDVPPFATPGTTAPAARTSSASDSSRSGGCRFSFSARTARSGLAPSIHRAPRSPDRPDHRGRPG